MKGERQSVRERLRGRERGRMREKMTKLGRNGRRGKEQRVREEDEAIGTKERTRRKILPFGSMIFSCL